MKLSSLFVITLALAAFLASCSNKTSTSTTTTDSTTTMTPEQKLARGRYLVTVSGCNDCHTPGTLYGAPDMSRMLSGSEVGWSGPWGTSYAMNLTPDPATGLGNYTEDDLVTAFRTGHKKDGSPILPPMPWPNFAHYTDEDAYAIAAFLKSVPPIVHAVPKNLPPGKKAPNAILIPAPGAWDAPKGPPPGGAAPDSTKG